MTTSARDLTFVSLLVVASLVSIRPVTGQETERPNADQPPAAGVDSLPFRPGQWGAEFAVDDGTVGLGVLRFRSPRKAWLLDASVSASWFETEAIFRETESGRSVFVNLRTGPRSYRPLATGSAAYVGTGLTGAYGWIADGNFRQRTWQAGVFGELGAVYFVTRRLSLGARVELSARYTASRVSSPTLPLVERDRRFSIGMTPVRIVGGLYF